MTHPDFLVCGGVLAGVWNQVGIRSVSSGMDETAAWHIALWEIEMQKHFAEDE